MKPYTRLSLAAVAFILLCQFSSQDNTVSGGAKPIINFYGNVTDLREIFKAQNITIDHLYKAIPAYQQPPLNTPKTNTCSSKDECSKTNKNVSTEEDNKNEVQKSEPIINRNYDPSDNITRLDLSEISKITISPNQKIQKFGNREYILIEVTSKDTNQSKNSYIIEADKRLFFDQINSAGPIEKEIKLRSIIEIEIDGYKQQEPDPITLDKKTSKTIQTTQAAPSKAKRLFSYVKNAFNVKRNS
jgi:hypothetical protein